MPDKTVEKSVEQLRQEAILVAFPGLSQKLDEKPIDCSVKEMVQLKVSVDEAGQPWPDESDKVDLDALIQTYKDQCGMEGAKRLLKQGVISPEDLADDGKGSYDGTVIPETAQARANAAVAAKGSLDAIKEAYGIPLDVELTQDQYDSLVKAYVEKNIEKFVKPTAEPVGAEGGDK